MTTSLSAPFRELYELSPDAILVFLGGNVTHANPAALELLRAPSLEALLGAASRDLIAPESLPDVEANVMALMSGAVKSTRSEEKYRRFDGTVVDVEVTAARAPFEAGKAFIVFLRDITDRKEAAERLAREREAVARTAAAEERERWLRDIIDLLPLQVFARDGRGAFVLVNRVCAEFFGKSVADMLGKTLAEIGYGVEGAALAAEDAEILRTGQPRQLAERKLRDGRGRTRIFEGVKMVLRRSDGQDAVLGTLIELTDRRALEEQLLHSQKMEGLGRLAGGVAHDFNNLLTVILESSEHLGGSVNDVEGDLPRIREAASRAASLTRQLLTFARQAPAQLQVTSIDELAARMAQLLLRVLGEDVRLLTELDAAAARAQVDPGQLEVVLMNVVVNARDAMPSGGTITLATRRSHESPRAGAAPARCIVLEIRDTGAGMDEATRRRAFEPFFTTKGLGAGTGLGLSTSYGIVQQLGGRIEIESVVGRGTLVRICIPECAPAVATEVLAPATPVPAAETVLLLEDDAPVRRATSRMLRSLGYSVLEAATPSAALVLARDHAGPIHALVTDVVMPETNGVEAARAFKALRPAAAVLFVSGYSADALSARHGEAPARLLPKPFTRVDLGRAVRQAIVDAQ